MILVWRASSVALAMMAAGCNASLGDQPFMLDLGLFERSDPAAEDGQGTVTIDPVPGQVELQVGGLSPLVDQRYEAWLAGGGEAHLSVGRFNTDASLQGSVSSTVGDISERGFEFFIITIEPEPDTDPDPVGPGVIGAEIPCPD
ncbi:MAG: anti-sigma factor [Myxococcota bacterium]